MQSTHVAILGGARLTQPLTPGFGGQASAASAAHAGANCIKAMPEASTTSTFGWYRPQRLLSQSERIPI